MKPIKLTESEKLDILRLHNSSIIIEQSIGKTIADIQTLVGTTPDNKLGPKTLTAIKTKLGQPDKSSTLTQKSTEPEVRDVDGFTYDDMIKAGWTDDTLLKSYGFNDKSKKYKTRIDVDTEKIYDPTSDAPAAKDNEKIEREMFSIK